MPKHQTPNKRKRKLSAFTLVELIVVVTILAILGTVGFLSLGGYSSNARDSQRSTDIANLSKSLDVSVVTVGSYPSPDNSFSVTYSGWTVWYQGTFSTGALSKLGGNGLNKRPLDPLKSTEYAYSTLAFGKAYSIKADYEWSVAFNPFVQTAHAAAGNPTVAFVRGNFGGLSAKTETGSVTYVIALPSILTNTGSAGATLEIKSNALSGTLLFNGKNLTNASSFNPTTVVFSGASLPKDDKSWQVTAMMTALKNAYAPSDVASSVPAVQTLVNTATWSLVTLGTSVIVGQLGGSATSAPTVTDNGVSGACTGLPSNATFYGGATGYVLNSAPTGTSFNGNYSATPAANTCQFKCSGSASWNGSSCDALLARWRVNFSTYGNATADYLAYPAASSFSFGETLANYQAACAVYGKNMYRNSGQGWWMPSCYGAFIDATKYAYAGCGNVTFNHTATSSKTYYNPSGMVGKRVIWIYYNGYSGGPLYAAYYSCDSVWANGDWAAICTSSTTTPLNGWWQWSSMSVNAGDIILCQDP